LPALAWPIHRAGCAIVPLFFLITALSEGANLGGVVVDNDSGAPISAATIQLVSEGAVVAETESGENGRFVFDDVGKGPYRLVATRNGYVSLFPQQSAPVAIADDGQSSPVALKLTRACFIAGQVFKHDGQPARGIKVVAMQRRMRGAAGRLVKAGDSAFTDDQGSYRLYGLAPGIYTVGIFPNGEETDEHLDTAAFSPIYFSGTTEQARAVFFQLAAGEGRSHADFTLEHRPGAKITGVVGGIPSGWAKSKVAVCLFSDNGDAIQTVETDAGGRFVFADAPRGSYQVVAWGPIFAWGNNGPVATPHGKTASLRIDAEDSEVSSANLELHDLATVEGKVSPKQAGGCSDRVQVALEPLDPLPGTQVFAGGLNQGAFRIGDVPAGRYRVRLGGLRGSCYLARVVQGEGSVEGMNISVSGDTKVRLVLADDGVEVSGRVTVPSGNSASVVLLIPAEANGLDDDVRFASPNEEGIFRFEGVPPGAYQVVALPKMTALDYMDPVFAAEHGAFRIVVKPGSSLEIEVTLSK
jgi:hypothetical protein